MKSSKADTIARLQALMDAVPASAEITGGTPSVPVSAGVPSFKPPFLTEGEKAAYERVVVLCGYNDFSREKMRARLLREGVAAGDAEQALDQAVRIGLIDDVRWGEMRAAALMRRGMGIPGIERELRDNRIDPSSIPGWPQAFAERFGDEAARALRLLEKNPPRSKNPQASAYARLMRKGYSSSAASQAAGQWAAQAAADAQGGAFR